MTKKQTRRWATRVYPSQARRGIYIDFEGFKDKEPSLVGILVENDFKQIILDPDLEQAAQAKNLKTLSLECAIRHVGERAKNENRKIFAFSQHELKVALEYTSVGRSFSSRYKDVHKIAKRWFNKTHQARPLEDWGLKSFMKFLDIPLPKKLGNHNPTYKLREVKNMLINRKEYDLLTNVKKNHWTSLLAYNKWDCLSLQRLVNKTLNL